MIMVVIVTIVRTRTLKSYIMQSTTSIANNTYNYNQNNHDNNTNSTSSQSCSADPRTEIRKLSLPVAASLSNLGGSLHVHVSVRVPQMGLYKARQGSNEVCPI